MAQVSVPLGTGAVGRVGDRPATRLFRMVSDRLAFANRRSRERDDLGAVISLARVGRETGVKC